MAWSGAQRPPGEVDVLVFQGTPGRFTFTPLSERAQDDLPAGTLGRREAGKLLGLLRGRLWKIRVVL